VLLDDALQLSNFDEHMDQELRAHLQHYCPDYFMEKKFMGVMKALVVGEASFDSSFRKLKLKLRPNFVNQSDCISFQNEILKLMSEHDSQFGNVDPKSRIKQDMNFCALLLGYTQVVPDPEFFNSSQPDQQDDPTNLKRLWEDLCKLPVPELPDSESVSVQRNPFPLLFLPPVRFICLRLCHVGNVISQQRPSWSNQEFPKFGNLTISQIYKQSLENLLSMAFSQKRQLNRFAQAFSEVGTALFHDAVEGALNLNDKKCTEMYVSFCRLNAHFILFFYQRLQLAGLQTAHGRFYTFARPSQVSGHAGILCRNCFKVQPLVSFGHDFCCLNI
jgi:hypothetical protein